MVEVELPAEALDCPGKEGRKEEGGTLRSEPYSLSTNLSTQLLIHSLPKWVSNMDISMNATEPSLSSFEPA